MIDRQTLNVTHSSAIAHRYTVLLTLPDRKMPLMEAGTAISRLCTMLRNLQIVHHVIPSPDCAPCYAISRLCTMLRKLQIVHHVTQSPDCAPCYAISRLRTMLHHLKIAHHVTPSPDCAPCYAISRLPVQSWDSENVQRNLEIAQILRLSGTYTICQGAWVN